MAPASSIPGLIVLALGAGALGFPDALRHLRDVAGQPRSPFLDIASCVLVMAVVTAYALGTMLLARFVRKPPGGAAAGVGDDAPPADLFALLTLVVSLGAALLVSACLLAAPGAGARDLLFYLTVDVLAWKSPVVAALVAVAAVIPFARRLLRAAPASSPADVERCTNATRLLGFAVVGLFVLAIFLLLPTPGGGLYKHRATAVIVSVSVGVMAIARRFICKASCRCPTVQSSSAPSPTRDGTAGEG